MAKDIVLASDGSAYSLQAARYIAQAGLLPEGGSVHIIHVTPRLPGNVARFVDEQVIKDWHEEEAVKVLKPTADVLGETGVPCVTRALVGFAPKEIARYADEIDAHMIVMGAHGRGVLLDAVLGSVAGRVLSMTRRPVLLIQQTE
ncbi:universal stress protein [uncultured Castellaniella sp.]|mgnify:CR=1 FL=1|uniref:universal stress protein n=1 Tax=uncultured Castellaniella sp. TaxID=647907 RepID=UPI00261AB7AD|nr:universal stress protein [uncultured Castellaniella sp.]